MLGSPPHRPPDQVPPGFTDQGQTAPLPATGQLITSQLPLGLAPTGDFAFVKERVTRDALDKWDALTPRADIRLHQGRVWFPEAGQCDFAAGFLTPTSWAVSQFCQRLGMPAHYFRKCPPTLQDLQFNHWITQECIGKESLSANGGSSDSSPDSATAVGSSPEGPLEPWLLRCKGDKLRSVLSSRYSPLDNDCLLESLAALLPKGFQVDWFSLTDESLHLRLVDPKTVRQVLPNDDLMVGLHVGNSEVGKRAVTVDALIYRLVCQNGMIRLVKGRSLLYRRHVSWSSARFQEALQSAIAGALATATEFLDQLQGATRTPVPDMPAVLELLSAQYSLSKSFLEAVEGSLKSEPASQQETVWGLVNGLTQAAQGLAPDDRYQVETLAGRLIESGLPKIERQRVIAPRAVTPQGEAPMAGLNGNIPHDLADPLALSGQVILAEPLLEETNALIDDLRNDSLRNELRKERDWHDEGSNRRADKYEADTFQDDQYQADTFGADEHPFARPLLGRA